MPAGSSAQEKDRRLKEVRVSREQIIAQRRNVIKKGVYLAGAGALAATTAGSLAAFIPPYVNPFTEGTYQVVWATSEARSAWANSKEGQDMRASDFTTVGLGGQGQVPALAMNVLVLFLDPVHVNPSMAGLVDHGTGKFAAFNAKCKHLGCTALWRSQQEARELVPPPTPITHDLLVCPCHLGTYDIYNSAKVIFGPPPEPLDQLRMFIEEDLIKVEFTRYKYGNGGTGGQVEDNPFYTG
jgi:Rieske Fe-S protein